MGLLLDRSGSITPGTMMVLYLSDEMDMDLRLPELYGFLGEDLMMDFLKVFGGRTVEVPPVAAVRRAVQAVQSHMRCEELSRKNCDDDAVAQVAVELDMTEDQVRESWASVRKMLARLEESLENAARQD